MNRFSYSLSRSTRRAKGLAGPRAWRKTLVAGAASFTAMFPFVCCNAQAVLEEVIVTAQKREQSLQDVPIAVQAFSGQALQEKSIKDVFDLQVSAPGLTVDQNQNATTSTFAVRGLGGGGNNFGIEPSVGVYVDGVYRSRANTMINQLIDMASIEVLRGPQGTLFGRNTLSGAMHFKTAAPDFDNSGFMDVTLGNYNLFNISGAASFTLIEDVAALRITGFSSDRDGWIDNLRTPGGDEINDRDRKGVRLQGLFTPTDTLTVRAILDYSELDEVCCGFATTVDNLGIDLRDGDGFQGSDALLPLRGGTVLRGSQAFDNIVALNQNPSSSSRDRGFSLQVDWDVGDITLTSISGWRLFNSYDEIDADFSDLDVLFDRNTVEQNSFSQEIRAAYTGDRFNFVVGAYYFTQDLDSNSTLTVGEDTEALAAVQALGLDPTLGGLSQYPLTFAIFGVDIPAAFPPGGFATDDNRQDHESWALFGQADFNISDTLVLTAGLRYSDEEKILNAEYFEVNSGFGFNLFPPTAQRSDLSSNAAFGADDATGNADGVTYLEPLTDSQVTGTAKVSWFARDAMMVYASISTGYKAGGTNTDRIDAAFSQTFDAETSTSFEIGLKAEFPERAMRLNAAIHYTTIDDYQVGTFTGTGFNVQNAATINTYGGELEWFWQASDTLTVTASYAMAIADFDEFERGNCWPTTPFHTGQRDPGGFYNIGTAANPNFVTADDPAVGAFDQPQFCDRSDGRLGTNPENFIVTSARKEFNVSDSSYAYVSGEVAWHDDMVLDQSNDPLSEQDPYTLANIRIGLVNEEYGAELTLWGRNIFDEDYNGTAAPAPLQDGRLFAYRREPATFGISFRKDW